METNANLHPRHLCHGTRPTEHNITKPPLSPDNVAASEKHHVPCSTFLLARELGRASPQLLPSSMLQPINADLTQGCMHRLLSSLSTGLLVHILGAYGNSLGLLALVKGGPIVFIGESVFADSQLFELSGYSLQVSITSTR